VAAPSPGPRAPALHAVLQRALLAPAGRLAPADVLLLQRHVGNAAVQRLLGAAAPGPPVRLRRPAAVQRISVEQAEAALDPREQQMLLRWADAWARSARAEVPSQGGAVEPHRREVLSDILSDVQSVAELRVVLSSFEEYRAKEKADPLARSKEEAIRDAQDLAARIHAALAETEAVGEYLGGAGTGFRATGIFVLNHEAYARAQVKAALESTVLAEDEGEFEWRDFLVLAANADLSLGYTDHETGIIYVREGVWSKHHLVHEALHAAEPGTFSKLLGEAMNEGTVELIAREASAELGIPFGEHYPAPRRLVEEVMDELGLDMRALKEAYFRDPGRIAGALRRRFSEALVAEFRKPARRADARADELSLALGSADRAPTRPTALQWLARAGLKALEILPPEVLFAILVSAYDTVMGAAPE
jgi:hypothetical protein